MQFEKVVGDYAFQQQIGQGQFSIVFKGYHIKTLHPCAIKQIVKKQLNELFYSMLQSEIAIIKRLKHPSILAFQDIVETPNNQYIITEYCDKNLLDVIKKQHIIEEPTARDYLSQTVDAIIYLHKLKIIHRDIKPPNILLKGNKIKLADFGFAQTEYDRVQQKEIQQRFQIGSPLYMSPETLFDNTYSFYTDIWSLGVLFYEMLFGTVPFFAMEIQDLQAQVRQYSIDHKLKYPREISKESQEILEQLLTYEPSKRISLIKLRTKLIAVPVRLVSDKCIVENKHVKSISLATQQKNQELLIELNKEIELTEGETQQSLRNCLQSVIMNDRSDVQQALQLCQNENLNRLIRAYASNS